MRVSIPAEEAARRLRSLFATSVRFSASERLKGRIDGMQFAAARHALLAGAADTVEFTARIEPEAAGCVLRGSVAWKLATRIQFIGFLLMGGFIAGTGFLQRFDGHGTANDVLLFGGGLFLITLMWLIAAYGMRQHQIEFIETRLQALCG